VEQRHFPISELIGGAILITIGTLMLLDRISFWDLFSFIDYWPLLLIAVGLGKLANPATRSSGIWIVAIGSWLQIMTLGLFGLSWWSAWPLLLVFAGAALILEGFIGPIALRHIARKEPSHGE